jgi:hypothetical protein
MDCFPRRAILFGMAGPGAVNRDKASHESCFTTMIGVAFTSRFILIKLQISHPAVAIATLSPDWTDCVRYYTCRPIKESRRLFQGALVLF